MPEHIHNHILYHDRTAQDWHRQRFPAAHWAIDIDLMGACPLCRRPLYLIESSTNPNKITSILQQLAKQADINAYLVIHDQTNILGGYRIWPRPRRTLSNEDDLATELLSLRTFHLYECTNPRASAGSLTSSRQPQPG